MKILFVAVEASPLAKVGGLADVVSSLPRMLNLLGHDVRIVIPKYGCIDDSELGAVDYGDNVNINISDTAVTATIKVAKINQETIVYLVHNEKYFNSRDIYSDNDLERFYFFNKAVVSLLSILDWKPDIVHCHDWHTGLVTMWLKQQKYQIPTVYTIHNLVYQGCFDDDFIHHVGLDRDWRNWPQDIPQPQNSFMSHGIIWADKITTVSENYAREILTPEFGSGLDSLLRFYKDKLTGIINGIDTSEYNPSSDASIVNNYSISTIVGKTPNKLYLQKKAMFIPQETIPLIGMVTRLVEQKGIDILVNGIQKLMGMDVQLFILGKGSEEYEKMICDIANKYPRRMMFYPEMNEDFASQVYAGSDMFLMPSRFEPCGLGQLIAMRYGTIPIVHSTGGLVDTVQDYNPEYEIGNGFIFENYSSDAMINAIKHAIDIYRDKVKWMKLVQKVMKLDFSWQNSARKYEAIYKTLMRNNEKRSL